MDTYRLDLLSQDIFEKIVVRICSDSLGVGVTGFTTGRDGGRDARFAGTARKFPSDADPWKGKFIVQAKHTKNTEASCSDGEFFGNRTSIISEEITKVKKLQEAGEIDNYVLLTNRKMAGDKDAEIHKAIIAGTGVANVAVYGLDFVERHLTPEIIRDFGLKRYLLPFEFYEKDIQEVIVLFGTHLEVERPSTARGDDFVRPDIKEKNELNNLTDTYFKNLIQDESLKYFKQIEDFLQDPRNQEYARSYEKTAYELKHKIQVERGTFDEFEKAFDYAYPYIFDEQNVDIVRHRMMIYVFLHFMYYQCDIGENK